MIREFLRKQKLMGWVVVIALIAFVDGEGQTCVCSIEKTKAIPQSDITVGLLDYEVTPNIHPAKILPFDFRKHIGDSGNPAFLVVGKEPLLLYTQHGGRYGSGSSMHSFRREIQAAMDEFVRATSWKSSTFHGSPKDV